MDITKKSDFQYLYDNVLIETSLVSSVEGVQDIVQKVLEDNIQLDYEDNLIAFIKNALDKGVPMNWLTGEVLFNIIGKEFEDIYEDEDITKVKKREKFISDFRVALFYSDIYSKKNDITDIVSRVLLDDKSLDNNDSLVSFIKRALDNGISINYLTGDELSEAFNVLIPGVKIISDKVIIENFDLNLMNGTSFIYGNKMLVFADGKMLYCDISKCDKSIITNKNDYTIKKYMQFIKEDYNVSKRVIESVIEQCKDFYPLNKPNN